MATVTIKNVPDDLYQRVKNSARTNRRSINSEIIVCLERSILARKIPAESLLARARELRKRSGGRMTVSRLDRARKRGRP